MKLLKIFIMILIQSGCALEELQLVNFHQNNDFEREKNDIYEEPTRVLSPHTLKTGLSKFEVRQSWGTPFEIQHSGDPELGHERWIYKIGPLYSPFSQLRVVYFESGRVSGWENF